MLDRRKNGRSKLYQGGARANKTDDKTAQNHVENAGSAGDQPDAAEFTKVVNYACANRSSKSDPKGVSLVAKMVWWRDTFVRIAFGPDVVDGLPVSDLGERLRQSEEKKLQLQRRIDDLLNRK
jgi:hypothetical protein